MFRDDTNNTSPTADIQQNLDKTLRLLNGNNDKTNSNQHLFRESSSSFNIDSNSFIFPENINYLKSTNQSTTSNPYLFEAISKTEMKTFSLFTQNCYHKCLINRAIPEYTKEQIKLSVAKFQSFLDKVEPVENLLPAFFNEIHNFSQICFESMNESRPSIQEYSEKVHESEMNRIKIQNQLISLQKNYQEILEKNHALSESIEFEHKQILSLLSQLSISVSPMKDDNRFIEKIIRIIQTEINKKDIEIQEKDEKNKQYSEMLSKFLFQPNSNPIWSDDPSIFETFLEDYKNSSQNNEMILQRILSEFNTQDSLSIQKEISKLKSSLLDSQKENQKLKEKIEMLKQDQNDLMSKNKESNDLSQTLSQTLSELQQQISDQKIQNDQLQNKNSQILKEKEMTEISNSEIDTKFKDLQNHHDSLKIELNTMKEENTLLKTQNNSLNSKLTTENVNKNELAKSLSVLQDECSQVKIELETKNESIDKLTLSLQMANSQVSELKRRNFQLTDELKQSGTVSEINQGYLAQIASLTDEVNSLNHQITELQEKEHELNQTKSSLNSLLKAYENLKLKKSQYKEELSSMVNSLGEFESIQQENESLKEKENQLEMVILKYKELKSIHKNSIIELKSVEKDKFNLEEQNKQLKLELDEFEKKCAFVEKSSDNLNREFNELKEKFNDISVQNTSLQTKSDRISTENKLLNENLNRCQNLLNDSLQKVELLKNSKLKLDEENRFLKASHDKGLAESKSFESQNKSLESAIASLKSDNANLTTKLNEQIQLNKTLQASSLEQNKTIKNLEIDYNSKVTELEAVQSIFKSAIETKEFVISHQKAQIDELKNSFKNSRQKVNISPDDDQIQIQEALIQSKEKEIENHKSEIHSLNEKVDNLSQINFELTQLNKSLSTQLDSKTETIETIQNQLIEMRKENSSISHSLDCSSLKISELETNQLNQSQLEKDFEILETKLSESDHQNQKLKETIQKLKYKLQSAAMEKNELVNHAEKLIDQIQLYKQKIKSDKILIKQLKQYIKSKEVSKQPQFDQSQIYDVIKKIESNLYTFPIEKNLIDMNDSLFDKLKNIEEIIQKVKDLYEEQDRSLERLTSLTSTQHETIIRMSKGKKE